MADTHEQPIFETVPVDDDNPNTPSAESPNIPSHAENTVDVPEIIPDSSEKSASEPISVSPEVTPEEITLDDIGSGDGSGNLPPDTSPFEDDGDGKRKYIFIGLGVVVFLLIFIGLVTLLLSLRGNKASKEPVELIYWGLWEDQSIMQPVIDEYQKEHSNIKITYTMQDPSQYREKLLARSREGNGPDIFRFHNTWLPTIAEITSPIPKNVMSNDEFVSTFYPVAAKDLGANDSFYGIPLEIDGLMLVYNKDLFQKAGVSTIPKTWEDILTAAEATTVPGTDNTLVTAGISLGTAENIDHFSDILGWMLLQNGANLNELNSQDGVDVLKRYRAFSEPQWNFWSNSMPHNITAFQQGKLAMIFVPSWQLHEIFEANPDLKVGTSILPVLPGGKKLSIANYWIEGVSTTSKHQQESWEFLKYLSSKETQQKLFESQSSVRSFGEPYSRVDLKDTIIDHEFIGPIADQADSMESLPVIHRTQDNGLNDSIVAILKDAVNATIGGVSYNKAMDDANTGVKRIFEEFNIQSQ